MATETNDIIMRMSLEGASSVSAGINRISSEAENAAAKISNAFDGSFASLRRLAGITYDPKGNPISRTYTNPSWKTPWRFDLGSKSSGFSMKVDSLGYANLLRDLKQLQESMSSQLKFFDTLKRASLKNSFFANRDIQSSSFVRWKQDIKTPISIPYYSNAESWNQNDVINLEYDRSKRKYLLSEEDNATSLDKLNIKNSGDKIGPDKKSAMYTMGKFSSKLASTIEPLMILGGATMMLTRAFKQLTDVVREHFYITKNSESAAMGGLTSGSRLFPYMQQLKRLGGDAASASAHASGFATDLAMLGFGGNGGRMIEAASLFGINPHGSGDKGFATYEEWMGRIAERMQSLTPSERVALKNVAGLDQEQFFAVSRGRDAYNRHIENSKTLLERTSDATGGGIFGGRSDPYHQEVSMDWRNSLSVLTESFDEMLAILSDAIAPFLSTIMYGISSIVQILNTFLAPITKTLGWIFKWINSKVSGLDEMVNNTPPRGMSPYDYYNIENASPAYNIHIGTINQADIGIPPNASKDEVISGYRNFLGNVVMGMSSTSRRA